MNSELPPSASFSPPLDSHRRTQSKGKDRELNEMDWNENQSIRAQGSETLYNRERRSNSIERNGNEFNHHHRRSETTDERQRRIIWWRSAAINVLYILAWYTFSTLISVYNKWMFSPDHYNFPYPLFVTSIHMVVQWSLSSLVLASFSSLRSKNRPKKKDYLSKVIPCGMATGLDIGLSNLSLRTITLSFYTMCKSSSLAFVLIFAFLFKLETPSWRLIGIILIITSGVVLMVSTETKFNAIGMSEVLTASALGGLRWSLTQILLDKEEMGMSNPFATLFWLAPIMGITLATTSMLVDGWGNVLGNQVFFGSFSKAMSTLAAILFPGVIAFLMNVTEFGLIQRTSVVTLSVAGIFKEVAVIFVSTVIFHDQLTPINISGLVVTISGIGLYNYLKYSQFTSGPDPTSAKDTDFTPIPDEWEEDDPSASPRGRDAARLLHSTNESALFLNDFNAPHAVGSDSEDEISPRNSLERNNGNQEVKETSPVTRRLSNTDVDGDGKKLEGIRKELKIVQEEEDSKKLI